MTVAAGLDALGALLGVERVRRDPGLLARYGRSDTTVAEAPVAVIAPRSREELIEIVRCADRGGVALYPVSRGENWGYGAACPVTKGQVLLDLRDMSRIVEVNEELAYAVVEPGVTQGQLSRHLADRYPALMMDCTGAPATTSLIGNALERGIGCQPGGRASSIAGMEIIRADGTPVRLGFAAYTESAVGYCRRGALGPDMEGLFLQSNLGIVSRLGIWLRPRPESVITYFAACHDRAAFLRFVDRFRTLWLRDGWASSLRGSRHSDQGWVFAGAVYGSRTYTAAFERSLRAACRDTAEVFIVDPVAGWSSRVRSGVRRFAAALAVSPRVPGWGRQPLRRMTSLGGPLTGSFFGSMTQSLRDGIARMVALTNGVPDEDEGIHIPLADEMVSDTAYPTSRIWFAPACPLTGAHVDSCMAMVESVIAEHGVVFFDRKAPVRAGMELLISDPRSIVILISLAYRRGDLSGQRQAMRCYDGLWDAAGRLGYVSYRVGIQGMHKLWAGAEVYWDTVAMLKRSLDPHGTIAPGRYDPTEATGGPFAARAVEDSPGLRCAAVNRMDGS